MSPHPGLLELCWPPLTCLAHFLRDPPSRFTHSKSLAKAFLLRPPLLLCPVGITLWPVRQNQMPEQGWGGGARSALRAGRPSLSLVSPSICLYFTSVSKGPSLGGSLACWVLFFPFNKVVIKQFTHNCRTVRKCIPVPGGATPRAMFPPHLLCWNTLMCTHVDV